MSVRVRIRGGKKGREGPDQVLTLFSGRRGRDERRGKGREGEGGPQVGETGGRRLGLACRLPSDPSRRTCDLEPDGPHARRPCLPSLWTLSSSTPREPSPIPVHSRSTYPVPNPTSRLGRRTTGVQTLPLLRLLHEPITEVHLHPHIFSLPPYKLSRRYPTREVRRSTGDRTSRI